MTETAKTLNFLLHATFASDVAEDLHDRIDQRLAYQGLTLTQLSTLVDTIRCWGAEDVDEAITEWLHEHPESPEAPAHHFDDPPHYV